GVDPAGSVVADPTLANLSVLPSLRDSESAITRSSPAHDRTSANEAVAQPLHDPPTVSVARAIDAREPSKSGLNGPDLALKENGDPEEPAAVADPHKRQPPRRRRIKEIVHPGELPRTGRGSVTPEAGTNKTEKNTQVPAASSDNSKSENESFF